MQRPGCYIIILFLLSHLHGVSQSLFSSGVYIDATSALDFVVGEAVAEYTVPAAIGFLPVLNNVFYCGDKCPGSYDIWVYFDNELEQATIIMGSEHAKSRLQYCVYGLDGIIYIQGTITTMPYYLPYTQLSDGVYILRIFGISDIAPYTVKWLKK